MEARTENRTPGPEFSLFVVPHLCGMRVWILPPMGGYFVLREKEIGCPPKNLLL